MKQRFERTPQFDIATHLRLLATPEELTDIVLDAEAIHLWCLSVFRGSQVLDPGRADGLGMTIRLSINGFLPLGFSFVVKVVDLVPHRHMAVAVEGDFEGQGTIDVDPVDDVTCVAEVRWRVNVNHRLVRPVAPVLYRLFVWNHDWATRKVGQLMEREVQRRRRNRNETAAGVQIGL